MSLVSISHLTVYRKHRGLSVSITLENFQTSSLFNKGCGKECTEVPVLIISGNKILYDLTNIVKSHIVCTNRKKEKGRDTICD